MSALVIALRTVALLAFAGPLLLGVRGSSGGNGPPRQAIIARVPVVANFAVFGLFFSSLAGFSMSIEAPMALPLALAGCVFALAGAAFVFRSRAELGTAWSLLPRADKDTHLATAGPYRLVRHPIYLGLAVLALGQAIAFGSWAASVVALLGIVPTFAWRAVVEEELLSRAFGDRYKSYRQRTGMMFPVFFSMPEKMSRPGSHYHEVSDSEKAE
jgi:protein-S-isoprenylcysteine O-methyltransferase Ste14